MTAELLPFYNRELTYIRKLAAAFAEEHPKIAGRLRLGPESIADPHVERLIEAFAYLTARIRHKLEDDFPEITQALLGVLYPHYQAPIPSMAIVQLDLDPEQNQLVTGYQVPRHTMLETDLIQGEACRFRTCYPVTLWPIELKQATLTKPPFVAPVTKYSAQAASVLRLVLNARDSAVTFSTLQLQSLRFFLKGQSQYVFRLYELILNGTLGVALARAPGDRDPTVLGPECLRSVGLETDEGLLPYPPRSFLGYRLLTEFFALPEKFLFFDLGGWSAEALAPLGNQLEIFFYLNQSVADLEHNIFGDTFRLGCTLIVNLYPQRAEPITLTAADSEYRIIPDIRRPLAHEVYAIDRVTASGADRQVLEFHPLFSIRHGLGDADIPAYWHADRRSGEATEGPGDQGSEVFLKLIDLDMQYRLEPNLTVDVETTCCNRDLPARLPFGGSQPRLQLSEGGGLVTSIKCLTPPTRTLRQAGREGMLWRLISHLSLNHLSLVSGGDNAAALREILRLYDFTASPQSLKMIDGIVDVASRRIVGRVPGDIQGAFCRGVEVTLRFDEGRYSGGGLFLFATVLERFLSLYCSVNSFTRLVARTTEQDGVLRKWPPRMGDRVLI